MARKISISFVIAGVVCFVVFMGGCAPGGEQAVKTEPERKETPLQPEAKEPTAVVEQAPEPQVEPEPAPPTETEQGVSLSLMPIAGEQATYRVTTQAQRSVKWEGPVGDDDLFEESRNDSVLEMVYSELIMDVGDKAEAVAQITTEKIKYHSIVKNQTVLDFDSSRAADADSPLAKLIGRSYTIQFTPGNRIPIVSDLSGARSLMSGNSPAERVGLRIFSPEVIRVHHGSLSLPGPARTLKQGEGWSRVKTFDFGLMGLKSYEKLYTFKDLEQSNGRRIAAIEMKAIPTAEVERQFKKRQNEVQLPESFDTTDTYTGEALLDIDDGRIEKCHEELHANWVAALPGEGQEGPVVLKMSAVRTYDLERID